MGGDSNSATALLEPDLELVGSAPPLGRLPVLRHPLYVAPLAGAIGIAAFASYPVGAGAAIAAFLAAVLVVLAATDIERGVIPNRIVLPAAAIVLAARMIFSPERAVEVVLAAIAAAVVLMAINLISSRAMGMGDVKLALLLGAGLGMGVIGAVVVAFLASFPFALATLARGGLRARKQTLPFGPFLAFGALVILIVPRLIGLGGG